MIVPRGPNPVQIMVGRRGNGRTVLVARSRLGGFVGVRVFKATRSGRTTRMRLTRTLGPYTLVKGRPRSVVLGWRLAPGLYRIRVDGAGQNSRPIRAVVSFNVRRDGRLLQTVDGP